MHRSLLLLTILLVGALAGGLGAIGETEVSPPAAARPKDARDQRRERRPADRSTERSAAGSAVGVGATLLAAGDIADCRGGAEETAALLRELDGTVATLGDHAYPDGARQDFADCYDPTWGAAKARTRPAPGNHEYQTPDAAGYFGYFGDAAGDPGRGYYSYDLGAWHLIALNSNCGQVGGCEPGSPQERWLRADLAANPAACTLAYWHHPLFTSGASHGGNPEVKPLWDALYAAGAEVVLSSHEHSYERLAPQDPDGRADRKRGIRQFVVGTGGAGLSGFGRPLPASEARTDQTYGVLRLDLQPDGYAWDFVPTTDGAFRDAGRAPCHDARGADHTGGRAGRQAHAGRGAAAAAGPGDAADREGRDRDRDRAAGGGRERPRPHHRAGRRALPARSQGGAGPAPIVLRPIAGVNDGSTDGPTLRGLPSWWAADRAMRLPLLPRSRVANERHRAADPQRVAAAEVVAPPSVPAVPAVPPRPTPMVPPHAPDPRRALRGRRKRRDQGPVAAERARRGTLCRECLGGILVARGSKPRADPTQAG